MGVVTVAKISYENLRFFPIPGDWIENLLEVSRFFLVPFRARRSIDGPVHADLVQLFGGIPSVVILTAREMEPKHQPRMILRHLAFAIPLPEALSSAAVIILIKLRKR